MTTGMNQFANHTDRVIFFVGGAVAAITAVAVPAMTSRYARQSCEESFQTPFEWLNGYSQSVSPIFCERLGANAFHMTTYDVGVAYAAGGILGVALKHTVVDGTSALLNRCSFWRRKPKTETADKIAEKIEKAEVTKPGS